MVFVDVMIKRVTGDCLTFPHFSCIDASFSSYMYILFMRWKLCIFMYNVDFNSNAQGQ